MSAVLAGAIGCATCGIDWPGEKRAAEILSPDSVHLGRARCGGGMLALMDTLGAESRWVGVEPEAGKSYLSRSSTLLAGVAPGRAAQPTEG